MKIVRNSIIPFKGFKAVMLFNIVFVRKDSNFFAQEYSHESIHVEQAKELLWIPFYLWYLIEFLIRIIQYRSLRKAYKNISFEREAYQNQNALGYLQRRRKYTFLRYLKQ